MTNKKRERFEKVAAARVTKTLDMLRLLKNCSNRANYDYTEQYVDKMFAEIDRVLKETREAYAHELSKNKTYKFSFMKDNIHEGDYSLSYEDRFLKWLISPDNPKRLAKNTAGSYVSYIKTVNRKLFCKTGFDILALIPEFVETKNITKINEMFAAMDSKLTERITEADEAEIPLNSLNNARAALRRYAEFIKSLVITE